MGEPGEAERVTFAENGVLDVAQLNELYRLVGWDSRRRRTESDTAEMLSVSRYYIAAHTLDQRLVGFARVCGDPYVVQVLDVIAHPDFRGRGIAETCMRGVVAHLQRSKYVSVTLTCTSELGGFYERFGFQLVADTTRIWRPA